MNKGKNWGQGELKCTKVKGDLHRNRERVFAWIVQWCKHVYTTDIQFNYRYGTLGSEEKRRRSNEATRNSGKEKRRRKTHGGACVKNELHASKRITISRAKSCTKRLVEGEVGKQNTLCIRETVESRRQCRGQFYSEGENSIDERVTLPTVFSRQGLSCLLERRIRKEVNRRWDTRRREKKGRRNRVLFKKRSNAGSAGSVISGCNRLFPDAIGCFRHGRPLELKPFIRWRARGEELKEERNRKAIGGSENCWWKKDGAERANEWMRGE